MFGNRNRGIKCLAFTSDGHSCLSSLAVAAPLPRTFDLPSSILENSNPPLSNRFCAHAPHFHTPFHLHSPRFIPAFHPVFAPIPASRKHQSPLPPQLTLRRKSFFSPAHSPRSAQRPSHGHLARVPRRNTGAPRPCPLLSVPIRAPSVAKEIQSAQICIICAICGHSSIPTGTISAPAHSDTASN